MKIFSTDGGILIQGILEDVIYLRKLTIFLALREAVESACSAVSVIKVSQAAIYHTNQCLEGGGHHSQNFL